MKKNILFLSAAERWNLGDLLFPITFAWYAKREGMKFINLGLREFSSHDADIIDVQDIRDYLHSKNSVLVIGGGEVLGASTLTLLGYIEEKHRTVPIYIQFLSKIARTSRLKILIQLVDRIPTIICQAKYGIYSIREIPFYVGVCSKMSRWYLPVGGFFPKIDSMLRNRVLQESVRNTQKFAARDERTKDGFPPGLSCELVPDPVSTITSVFPSIERKKRVVVQFSRDKLPFELEKLVELLRAFSSEGYEVHGLAIGRCLGHHDIDSLHKLQSKMPELLWLEVDTVKECCEVLSSASVYIGTSLHGAIISHAYGNAVIGISSVVPKLSSYMKTWFGVFAINFNGRSEIRSLVTFVDDFDYESASQNARDLSERAEDYIQRVLKQLKAQ